MFFNSNTVFMCYSEYCALLCPRSLPTVLVYTMAKLTIFWTIGVYLIQGVGPKPARLYLKKALGKVFSPPLLGFMFGMLLVLCNIKLPEFLMADQSYV